MWRFQSIYQFYFNICYTYFDMESKIWKERKTVVGMVDEVYQLERFSKTKEEFDVYYDEHLVEKIKPLEEERQETINLAKKKAMKLVIPLIALLLLYFILPNMVMYGVAIFIFLAVYLFKDVKARREKLRHKIKKEIVTDLVHFMNENFKYKPDKYVSSTNFKRANIFKERVNQYEGDDLITGYVGGKSITEEGVEEEPPRTDVSFSEIKADQVKRYKDKDGKTNEAVHTIFQGLFFKADFNKDFNGLTIVVPKTNNRDWFSFLNNSENKLEDVELENIDFMNKFTVRTTDPILARYILTPGFMNRLFTFSERESTDETLTQPTSVKEAFQMGVQDLSYEHSATPYFSFRDGTMYFLLPTRTKHFEFNVLSPLNKNLIYSYFKDINLALELVDELNLNLRIWTKK